MNNRLNQTKQFGSAIVITNISIHTVFLKVCLSILIVPFLTSCEKKEETIDDVYHKGLQAEIFGDYKTAVRYYVLAAEKCHPEAQHSLGNCYEYGNGVEKDLNTAVKWYRLAAEQGDIDAMANLGHCYSTIAKKDSEEAVKWFRMGAEQGQISCQYMLGLYYAAGEGIDMDLNEATKWLQKAAEQGHEEAKITLNELKTKQ